jgi:hypothetical protein
MKSAHVLVGALVIGMLVSTVPSRAGGQEAPPSAAAIAEAERHFNEGVAATEQGDFDAAFQAFQASYELNPLPDVLYNIGMCRKALGDLPGAANAFREYVTAVGGNLSPAERAEFDALLAELMPQIGRLTIQSNEAGATVTVDGIQVGSTPLPGWYAVASGHHQIEVAKDRFVAFLTELDVAGGQSPTVSATLVALEGTPGADGEPGGLSPWFWTCAGVAGASVLTMAITGGLTLKYNDDFDAGGRTDSGLRDTTLALRTTTDVFLGIGLAAVVVGTVLFFVLPDDESEAEPARAGGVAVVPSGLVVWW